METCNEETQSLPKMPLLTGLLHSCSRKSGCTHCEASPATASYFCSQSEAKANGPQTLLPTDHSWRMVCVPDRNHGERREKRKGKEACSQQAVQTAVQT